MGTIYSQRKKDLYPGSRRGRHFQLCRIADVPGNGERCKAGEGWEDVKVALPVVRGLHGSRAEGTTRRFKVDERGAIILQQKVSRSQLEVGSRRGSPGEARRRGHSRA